MPASSYHKERGAQPSFPFQNSPRIYPLDTIRHRRLEIDDRRWETGDRRQRIDYRSWETGERRQKIDYMR